jgi:hypothetical protein
MNIILEKGWEDKAFIEERTEGLKSLEPQSEYTSRTDL